MPRTEFSDPRSRDQYPVDEDQDGNFENIDSDNDARDPDTYIEFSDIPGTGPEHDSYDEYGEKAYGPGNRGVELADRAPAAEYDPDVAPAAAAIPDLHSRMNPEEVRMAAVDTIEHLDPNRFQESVNDALTMLPEQHLGGIADAVLHALGNAGFTANRLTEEAGLTTIATQDMTRQDLSNLLTFAQQAAPEALGDALADNPRLGQALGNTVLKGLFRKLGE